MFPIQLKPNVRRDARSHGQWSLARVALAAMFSIPMVAAVQGATMEMGVNVRDAWIRWLPGNLPAGGYLTVVNDSDHAVSLLQASSPDYAKVSLHQTRQSNGTTSMVPVSSIKVGPKSTLRFESEGYHLMLEQPTHDIVPGHHVTVTLRFDDAPPVSVAVTVRRPSDGPPSNSMPGMPGMSNMPGMGH